MKIFIKGLLSILMSLSLMGIIMTVFVEKIYTPTYLNQAVDTLDLMQMVEQNVSGEYAKVLEPIMETEEFKTIVYDYAHAFVENLCGYETTYEITDEQETILFTLYSSTLLEKYPQLKILPTDLFIDFLVDRIDLNSYLPTFEELKAKIPSEFFVYKDKIVSSKLRITLGLIVVVCFGIYTMLSNKISLYGLIFPMLVCCGIIGYILSLKWLNYLPQDYSFFENAIILLVNELDIYLKYCIIIVIACLGIEWGKFCAKKIFLF